MEDRFKTFTGLILETSKMIQRIKNYEMNDYGLKAVHVMCLYYLNIHKDGLTHKELVILTYEDKAAVSRALALLKDKGLIDYDVKKYNSKILLEDKGKMVAAAIMEKAQMAVSACGEGISDSDRIVFYRTLSRITKNLEEYCQKFKEE